MRPLPRIAAACGLILLALAVCSADTPAPSTRAAATQPEVKATCDKTKITLQEERTGDHPFLGTIDLASVLPFKGLSDCEILHEAKSAGMRYYLLDVRAESRPGSPMSYCGAGEESVVVWVCFNPSMAAESVQMQLYRSCWNNLEGSRSEKDGIVRFTAESPAAVTTIEFDRAKPQAGLKIQRQVISNP